MARKKAGGGGWLLFWLAFFIGITLLFMLNLERIKGTLQDTRILERLSGGEVPEGEASDGDDKEDDPELDQRIRELAPAGSGRGLSENSAGTAGGRSGDGASTASGGVNGTAESRPSGGANGAGSAAGAGGASGAAEGRSTAGQPPANGTAAGAKTVERLLYLMKVDNTGTILWAGVKRSLPASDKPLQDALESLIRGPLPEEEKQGLISLIPKNVKILNATVRGSTAYISFNEDFLFNTYGVEGYAGQRRQIVLTATEFSNVRDVQILIDGKRVDYLGEGIWIGSPVSRNML